MLDHIPRKWQIHLTEEIILHVQMLKKCSETRNKNFSVDDTKQNDDCQTTDDEARLRRSHGW